MKKMMVAFAIATAAFLPVSFAAEQPQPAEVSAISYTTASSYYVTYQGKRYISGVYENTWMNNHMANPETKVSAFIYDKNKKRNATLAEVTDVITLTDMKKAIQNGKATLYNSEWKKLKLTERFFPEDMTKNFYLDKGKEGVVLVFQPGDLAPYSEGVTYVVVPFSYCWIKPIF